MCGITGVFRYDLERRRQAAPLEAERLRRMCRALTHRGPDDEGVHLEKNLGLAMRRSAAANPAVGIQPLYSESHDTVVVADGDIYNVRQLRAALQARGHRFRTDSDCEVLVHLYGAYGLGMFSRLRGSFAFALWDARRERLLLARDRIGIKPLYVAKHDGALIFASEPKGIVQSGLVPRQVDLAGLHHYLSLGCVPAPSSLLRGVEQLLPGEYLVCDEGGARRRRYWHLEFRDEGGNEAEWTRRVRDKLAESVSIHLMGPGPAGAIVSGSVESRALVGLMAGLLDAPVQTFALDALEQAQRSALGLLEELTWYADAPLSDGSAASLYLLARHAKEHVPVVLLGVGADEVFAGHESHGAHHARELYRKMPRVLREQLVGRVIAKLPAAGGFGIRARRFLTAAELGPDEVHLWSRARFAEEAKQALYTPAFRQDLGAVAAEASADLYRSCLAECRSDDPLARSLYVDTRLHLPADTLLKVDRMTMASGLQARLPFLDHELVELLARAPSRHKLRRGHGKHLLREAVADLLPPASARPRRPTPEAKGGPLTAALEHVLSPERLEASGLFDPDEVRRLQRAHRNCEADHGSRLWLLLSFQLWYERFVAPHEVRAPAPVEQRWCS